MFKFYYLKLFLALSLLVHTLIFISVEWFLPFTEKTIIDAIPVRFIQEFEENVVTDLIKNDEPTKPEETEISAHLIHPILYQNKSPLESSNESSKPGQEKIPEPVKIKAVEIKAPKTGMLAQAKAFELVVSELVLDRKLPTESTELIVPIQEAKKPDTKTMAKVVKVPLSPAKIRSRDNGANKTAGTNNHLLQSYIENPGNSGKKDEVFLFMTMVRKKIEEAKFYPRSAKRRGYEGTVTVKFKILPDGTVTSLEFDKSAQPEILNRAARQAIQKAAPFKRRPKSLENQEVKLKIPIAFRLK